MKNLRNQFAKTQTYVLIIVVIYCIFVASKTPAFLSYENIFDVVKSTSWMWILGLGAMLVIISGGIDLSFTFIAVCSAYTGAVVVRALEKNSIILAFFIAALVGMLFGAINAVIIHYFHLPAIFVTLGTRYIFLGLTATFVGVEGLTTSNIASCFRGFGQSRLFVIRTSQGLATGLSVFIIPVVIFAFLVWYVLKHTKIGRSVIALGNSEIAAERVGYNLLQTRFFVFIFSGLMASVAGVMAVAEICFIAPMSNNMISGLELTIVAAVIIGGAKLSGGEGTVAGTFLGILLIQLFNTTMVFIGLTSFWTNFFTGGILIICLVITSLQSRIRSRKMLLFDD